MAPSQLKTPTRSTTCLPPTLRPPSRPSPRPRSSRTAPPSEPPRRRHHLPRFARRP
ncbi:hypothetical protein ACFPRL_21570 [Pseudoclavibacter helvolus]